MIIIGISGSIVVCISPLTSLMIDQHAKYTPSDHITEFVAEAQCEEKAIDRVIRTEVQLVYISPESVMCNPTYMDVFISLPFKKRLIAPAVDEAHCRLGGMSFVLTGSYW